MVRSEKQERSDIVYIELDGESRESGAGGREGGRTRWDGKRRRTEEGTGWQGEAGVGRRCGGSGWMQEHCARRVRKREGGHCGRRRWRSRRKRLRSNGDVSVHANAESASALALTSRRNRTANAGRIALHIARCAAPRRVASGPFPIHL